MGETGPDPLKDFESSLKEWGSREPKTAPEDAARRVLAQLPEREKSAKDWWRPFLLPAAALMVLALGYGIFLRVSQPPPDVAVRLAAPPVTLDENTALIWLDAETPLYMTLAAPESAQGENR
jgi:hypothetical protein